MSTDAAHFTSGMPTKRLAADCVLTDEAGRLLVPDPPYNGKSRTRHRTRRTTGRGLEVPRRRLIEVLALLFDGGHLTPRDIDRIVIDPAEVRSYRFVELEEVGKVLDAELFARVSAGLAARTRPPVAYLEDGVSRLRP